MTVSIDRERLVALLASFCPVQNEPVLINGVTARENIEKFFKQSRLRIDAARVIFDRPQDHLGAFCELPEPLRLALAAAASFRDQEHQLTNLPRMRRWVLLPIWKLGNIFLSAAFSLRKRYKAENPGKSSHYKLFEKIFFRAGKSLTTGTLRISRKILDCLRFFRFYKQPFFYAFWRYLGVDTKTLCYAYIDSVPAHPALGPIFRFKDAFISAAVVLGVDFLPSTEGLYFIEANFNPGFRSQRLELYNGNDPVGTHLVQYAKHRGYKHIILYGGDIVGNTFDQATEQLWLQMARAGGLSFEVVDYQFGGRVGSARKAGIDLKFPQTSDTLIVLARSPVSSSLSALVSEKGNLDGLIEKAYQGTFLDKKMRLPKRYQTPGEILGPCEENRFPNLIIKNRRKDRGSGIELFRLERVPDNYPASDYVINEFVIPSRIETETDGRIDEFVYDIRCLVLITVDGPVYLGSYRRKSAIRIPQNLPWGKIDDIRPYVANISLGGSYDKIDQKEDLQCRQTALQIGDMICQFIHRKFVVEINGFSRIQR